MCVCEWIMFIWFHFEVFFFFFRIYTFFVVVALRRARHCRCHAVNAEVFSFHRPNLIQQRDSVRAFLQSNNALARSDVTAAKCKNSIQFFFIFPSTARFWYFDAKPRYSSKTRFVRRFSECVCVLKVSACNNNNSKWKPFRHIRNEHAEKYKCGIFSSYRDKEWKQNRRELIQSTNSIACQQRIDPRKWQ